MAPKKHLGVRETSQEEIFTAFGYYPHQPVSENPVGDGWDQRMINMDGVKVELTIIPLRDRETDIRVTVFVKDTVHRTKVLFFERCTSELLPVVCEMLGFGVQHLDVVAQNLVDVFTWFERFPFVPTVDDPERTLYDGTQRAWVEELVIDWYERLV
jgi:hypothetical protein|uniref:Uncharacterized protein n=1 Tax=viral metagenome TaxID=1070528 RepID=A0A6C0IWG8_9ZZZZ